MKKNILLTTCLLAALGTSAQDNQKKWWQDIKQSTTFSGYVVGRATFNDQDLDSKNETHSSFDIRLIRVSVNGQVWDFKYGLQMEMSGVGGSSGEKGPRVLDAWTEWCKFGFFSVKFGQFKRGFTFENPMSPWDIGFGSYSLAVTSLAGMSDRVGEHTCNGRDFGLQIQGDLFPSQKDGHHWLHYQLGVYNGQGINHSDRNNAKDLIGGLWVSPAKDLCIGAFGWAGDYCDDVNDRKITVDRNRMAFGLKYESRWTVRGEYITSQGHKVSDYQVDDDGNITVTGRDKADGWYATVGAPVTSRCKIYAKWDVYRDQKNNSSRKSLYNVSVNYNIYKNLKLQALYGFVEDRTYSGDSHYNTGEVQVYWRF